MEMDRLSEMIIAVLFLVFAAFAIGYLLVDKGGSLSEVIKNLLKFGR